MLAPSENVFRQYLLNSSNSPTCRENYNAELNIAPLTISSLVHVHWLKLFLMLFRNHILAGWYQPFVKEVSSGKLSALGRYKRELFRHSLSNLSESQQCRYLWKLSTAKIKLKRRFFGSSSFRRDQEIIISLHTNFCPHAFLPFCCKSWSPMFVFIHEISAAARKES